MASSKWEKENGGRQEIKVFTVLNMIGLLSGFSSVRVCVHFESSSCRLRSRYEKVSAFH